MLWVPLALAAALSAAAREALMKSVVRGGDEVAVAFLIYAVAALALLAAALPAGLPPLGRNLLPALLVSGGINAVAAVLVAKAVHRSDLSLVSPLQSTTPVFMVLSGWLILGELPSLRATFGIVVIVAGAYVLNMGGRSVALTAPFRALLVEPGARLFLIVAAIFAISGAVDKVGVAASSPVLWGALLNVFVTVALWSVMAVRGTLGAVRTTWRGAALRLGGAGIITAAGLAAQFAALPLTLAAYVIAVKRTSVLFSVALGSLVFGEAMPLRRFAGAAIMLAGFALITL
jgi:drug/metabolite transporter (DMT)-like permease